ncbi:MAG: hypothetical protein GY798_09405 [Hyphomicrobiales bacterium]|nr:hypothetical protein [Hyphomicrobiales bacterium]
MVSKADLCLANNLDWYRAVLGAFGLRGEVGDGLWTCGDRVPPYHSNAITLSPTKTRAQYAAIARLATRLNRGFSVKDSFAALDLSPLGFNLLFDARWIWREPADRTEDPAPWTGVTDPTTLRAWEAAWRDNGSPTDQPVFAAPLLADSSVGLFAAWQSDRIVAGCAANRSGSVVGLSNFFTASDTAATDYAAAIEAAAGFAPGLPVVGYESGATLDLAERLGFQPVGELRVWLRDDA